MEFGVSAVIPTYNRGRLVVKAIQSVLAQTCPAQEIIVVDDGSSDGTGRILQEVYGDRIRYLYQSNQGPSAARNRGIAEANGKWVAFLDSDDVWLPDKLEWQLRALDRFGPDHGACYSDAKFMNNSLMAERTVFQLAEQHYEGGAGTIPDPIRLLLAGRRVHTVWVPTLVARADVVRNAGGFDPKLRFAEDDEFLFRLGMATGFCYVNVPLTLIDRTPAVNRHTGVSEVWDKEEFRFQQTQYRYEKRWSLSDRMPRDIRKMIQGQLRSLHSAWASWYLASGDYAKAKQAMSNALRYRPGARTSCKWFMTMLAPSLVRKIVMERAKRRASSNPAGNW